MSPTVSSSSMTPYLRPDLRSTNSPRSCMYIYIYVYSFVKRARYLFFRAMKYSICRVFDLAYTPSFSFYGIKISKIRENLGEKGLLRFRRNIFVSFINDNDGLSVTSNRKAVDLDTTDQLASPDTKVNKIRSFSRFVATIGWQEGAGYK